MNSLIEEVIDEAEASKWAKILAAGVQDFVPIKRYSVCQLVALREFATTDVEEFDLPYEDEETTSVEYTTQETKKRGQGMKDSDSARSSSPTVMASDSDTDYPPSTTPIGQLKAAKRNGKYSKKPHRFLSATEQDTVENGGRDSDGPPRGRAKCWNGTKKKEQPACWKQPRGWKEQCKEEGSSRQEHQMRKEQLPRRERKSQSNGACAVFRRLRIRAEDEKRHKRILAPLGL
mmetsp:Transcript_9562/g.22649  ORF Transcript_9562/g.22649 Transcript_9562/m.22649 type:complete len:232 (-) Transcript_9562:52-747(-)